MELWTGGDHTHLMHKGKMMASIGRMRWNSMWYEKSIRDKKWWSSKLKEAKKDNKGGTKEGKLKRTARITAIEKNVNTLTKEIKHHKAMIRRDILFAGNDALVATGLMEDEPTNASLFHAVTTGPRALWRDTKRYTDGVVSAVYGGILDQIEHMGLEGHFEKLFPNNPDFDQDFKPPEGHVP